MRAIVRELYGGPDVLRLEELDRPHVGDDDVRVRVRAASVGAGDWHILRGEPLLVRLMLGGLFRPRVRVIGSNIAGRVEAVGKDVRDLRPGDDVFGDRRTAGSGDWRSTSACRSRR